MTTYFYTFTLDDTEAITLRDALTKYIQSNEGNAQTAKRMIEKLYESVEQGSGQNFSEPLALEVALVKFKTDLFEAQ